MADLTIKHRWDMMRLRMNAADQTLKELADKLRVVRQNQPKVSHAEALRQFSEVRIARKEAVRASGKADGYADSPPREYGTSSESPGLGLSVGL